MKRNNLSLITRFRY